MPHIRNWITTHGDAWLPKLIEDYKIDVAKTDLQGLDLVSLKYNAIESPMHEPIVQECRGMIVARLDAQAQIVAHPYNKFWNLGESKAAEIDWSTARVQAKLDGSLALLYDTLRLGIGVDHKHTGWQFGSSGTPLGGGKFNGDQVRTFGDVFWETFHTTSMKLPTLWRGFTFCFELVSPDNRIVVFYDKPQLILHGARNIETEEEMSRDELEYVAKTFNWPIVQEYPLTTLDEVMTAVAALDPVKADQGEGFVVVDAKFNRVKVKSAAYVALHHLRDKFTPRGVIHLWKAGEIDEVLVHFPEIEQLAKGIAGKLEAAASAAFVAAERYHRSQASDAPISRKDFALTIKAQPWSSIAFRLIGEPTPPSLEAARRVIREAGDALAERLVEETLTEVA